MAVLPADLIKLIFNQYSPVTTVTSTTPKDTHRTTAAQLYSQHEASLKEYFVVCSQVCRLWHDLSQPYLFTTLAIPFGTSAPSDLLAILARLDAYPAPIKWVHHLRLVMRSPPPQDEYEGCDPQLLRALLYRFELARVVEMVDVVFRVSETEGYAESLQADLQTAGTPIEPNNRLEKISFSYPSSDCSPTVDTILYMLKWMGDVDEVNIEPYYWLHWTTRLTREDLHLIPTAFNVNTLNIVAYYLPDIFLQCLRGSRAFQDDAQGLKKLYFKAHGTSDQHLRMLLLPTSLKELHLDFDSFFDQGPRGELTPSICTCLTLSMAMSSENIRDVTAPCFAKAVTRREAVFMSSVNTGCLSELIRSVLCGRQYPASSTNGSMLRSVAKMALRFTRGTMNLHQKQRTLQREDIVGSSTWVQ